MFQKYHGESWMRNKVFIGLMLFILLEGWIVTGRASVTFQQVKQVWAKMENSSGVHIPLYYIQDRHSNAYSTAWNVTITAGLLQDLQNADQIAFVLGHELGHYVRQHYRQPNSMSQELQADKLGVYYCKKLSYKKCKSFFVRAKKVYGDRGGDIHPSWTYRLKAVGE